MNIRPELLKITKYEMDLLYAAKYVAGVLNDDVPMGKREEAGKKFLENLAMLTRKEVKIPSGK